MDPDINRVWTLACLISQPIKVGDSWPSTLIPAAPEAKHEFRSYESVICDEELCTLIYTKVQHEPPSSADKDMVDILVHSVCFGMPNYPA